MIIRITTFQTILFLYNFFAHLSLFILNLLYNKDATIMVCNKHLSFHNYDKLLFLIGHILISFVMLFRIGINLSGTIIVSLIGSIAHSLLFLSNIFNMLKMRTITLIDIIFMVGQIGMIYTYCIEHILDDVKVMSIVQKMKILGTFIGLAFYYLYSFLKTKNILKYGKLAVFLVYVCLIVLFYLHNEKYNYINIF
tara:strand:- start:1437 stop:2021 length:585 start_codon:yes stop_codon:yes gene_type:complete